jgi:hypothetical protein
MVVGEDTIFYGHQSGVKPGIILYEDILIGKNEEVHR